MNTIEKLNSQDVIDIGISPQKADLAIVSIDDSGTSGTLNSFVLKEYGYSERNLPKQEQLVHGFSQLSIPNKKPILFVVTVSVHKTSENLEKNLFNTLIEFRGWFQGKKVWIPLMGTGAGGLSFEESYIITVQTINKFRQKFPTKVIFIISLPKTDDGQQFFKQIKEENIYSENEIETFLKSINSKFYLVGSIWGGEDQITRFINNSTWEKGHDDESYSSLINKMEKNDILIIKSTFAKGNVSYLRIKAIGIVINNPQNGATIKVDWKITDLSIDIEQMGHHRYTISVLNINEAALIISRISKNLWDILFSNTSTTNRNMIAGLISDSDKGIDYLEINKDVTAFARVIAAKSFIPPLAIALFGKWGSGKSFFMHKLKDQISAFSNQENNEIYCNGIANIQFNAWSYMDSNLWASIVTRIFEGLNEYISENSKSVEAKKEIEKQLNNQLSIAKEEISILENKKKSVAKQIISLENKRNIIIQDLNEKIEKVKNNTIWNVIEKIDQQFNAKEKITKALRENLSNYYTESELKDIVPEKYWNDPQTAYSLVKSKYLFLKEFFRKDKIKSNLVWLAIILLIIFIAPMILGMIITDLRNINFQIPQAGLSFIIIIGSVWKRSGSVYRLLQPVIASFWSIKEDYEKQSKMAISKFEQEEKGLKLEIEKGRSDILLIEEQIQKVESIKSDLEFKINNAVATEALYSFIDKRSKSEDYKKHLGIISIIRKDFEILNDLFIYHNLELKKANIGKQFNSKFKKPLERIILYIDDLDRCPEENVVQVLEAVNLLMAFPLFIVIVGVDSRWVKNALVKKHRLQFTGRANGNEAFGDEVELIEPSNYLEKIFQVPFHLKDAKDISIKGMVKQLAQNKPNINGYTENIISDHDTENFPLQIPAPGIVGNTEVNTLPNKSQTARNKTTDKPEALVLNDQEILLMQDISEIIGNNPRAIKRFVNIFRIIKAHEEFDYDKESDNSELLVILFLLALPLGEFRKLITSFKDYIQNKDNHNKLFSSYFSNIPIHKDTILLQSLKAKLASKPSFIKLQNAPVSVFYKHNFFIERFTFKNM